MTAPYIADSYTRASAITNILIDEISQNITAGEKSMATLVAVRDRLGAMASAYPAGYVESIQYVNAMASANPSDAAWQALKAKMDKAITDFQVANSRFTTITAAIDGM